MPIDADDLDESRFIDEDGNLLDPADTPFVLMPDPKACDRPGPCQIWIVTKGGQGYLPTEATRTVSRRTLHSVTRPAFLGESDIE